MADIKKEGEGGGFGDSGGTAFTSTDAGIFTPTYSDRSTRKKNNKKKRTGIDRLADFLVDNSPERKMAKSEELGSEELIAVTDLVKWVTLAMRKSDRKGFTQQNSGTNINDQIPSIEWEKDKESTKDSSNDVVEFDAEPSAQAAAEQTNVTDKIKQLDDGDVDDTPKPQTINNVKKDVSSMLSAGVKYDALQQGGDKDKSAEKEIEEPYAEGTEVVEEEATDEIAKLLKLLDKY